MAGGMLAAALAEQSLDIILLDGAPEPKMPTGAPAARVSALTETSERLLRSVGAWKNMPAPRLQPYDKMEVRDGDGTGEVHFSAADAAASHLGTLVENDSVVAAIFDFCRDACRVDWRSDCRVASVSRAEQGWRVELADGQFIDCRLLVGADGARSMVRSAAGIIAPSRSNSTAALPLTALH